LSRLSRTLFALCVAAAPCATARAPRTPPAPAAKGAAEAQRHLPTLKPTNIIESVMRRKAASPALSAAGLARYANELLARTGFSYDFDSCEVYMPHAPPANTPLGTAVVFDHRLTRLDGREVAFRFVTDNMGAPCGECYLSVPALRVTKREFTVVADGTVYNLKRPASFRLDEAQLLDASMKRVLRTWQLPYQAVPEGVSPDWRSLYLGFYTGTGLDELLLEISEDGRPRFRVRAGAFAGGGEWITERPNDPNDTFEGYMRFRAGGRSHVIRFTGPCT
jgi:hypothetical protein